MKKPIQITLCFIALVVMSCSTLKVKNATRVQHTPGVPTASKYVVFTFDLHTTKDISLTDLYLESGAEVKHIDQVDCLDTETKETKSITVKDNQQVKSGNYQMSFRQMGAYQGQENQNIVMDYMVNGKMRQLTFKVYDGGYQNDR